jgi:hypothetical protein
MFEETNLTLNVDDLILLSGVAVWMSLSAGKHQLVYVYSASVPTPYVNAKLHTPTKVKQAVIAQSTVHPNGSYVVSATVDIDRLSMTPSVTDHVKETQRKYELLHFAVVAFFSTFSGNYIVSTDYGHQNTSLPM